MGSIFAFAGFFAVTGAMTQYFLTIAAEKVPKQVGLHMSIFAVGIVLSLVGIITEPSGLTWSLGVLSISMGGLVLFLLSQRRLPDGALIATLGEPMPALSAVDHTGAAFDLASLQGQRVLFKFFRGSW